MMKKFFNLGTIAILVAFMLILVSIIIINKANASELYPACGIVVEIDEENDLVMVEDFNGDIWIFEGIEDWFIGDICAMMMDDNGTDTIYDDIIVSVRYCGWVE